MRNSSRGGPPPGGFRLISVKLRYLEEFSELSKILPDSAFSDLCLLQVSRVLAQTFSSWRNVSLNLYIFQKVTILTGIIKESLNTLSSPLVQNPLTADSIDSVTGVTLAVFFCRPVFFVFKLFRDLRDRV